MWTVCNWAQIILHCVALPIVIWLFIPGAALGLYTTGNHLGHTLLQGTLGRLHAIATNHAVWTASLYQMTLGAAAVLHSYLIHVPYNTITRSCASH